MKKKVYFLFEDKKKIVGKVYAQQNMIKSTAPRYKVQPTQIHHWRATIPATGLEEDGAAISTSRKNMTLHKGRNTVITHSPVSFLWIALCRGLHCNCKDACHWAPPFGCRLNRWAITHAGSVDLKLSWKKKHCLSSCHMNCTEHQIQSSHDGWLG